MVSWEESLADVRLRIPKEFSMLRLGIAACAAAALVLGDGFTFTISSPVASSTFR